DGGHRGGGRHLASHPLPALRRRHRVVRGGGRPLLPGAAVPAASRHRAPPTLSRHFAAATGLYAAVADHFCRPLLARLRRGTRDLPPGHGLLHHQILSYLTFIDEDPNVYRFLNRQVPPDRERSVTHHSGFSRLIADATADHLRTAGWGKRMSFAGADLFVGGLE